MGKVHFLSVLFQHATFISSGRDPVGTLADISPESSDLGFLAFIRLVGCSYFKKHLAAFVLNTPEALFHSISATSPEEHHHKWLDVIRQTIFTRVVDESHTVPSYEALQFHWKRSTWVAMYWSNAAKNNIQMPGL